VYYAFLAIGVVARENKQNHGPGNHVDSHCDLIASYQYSGAFRPGRHIGSFWCLETPFVESHAAHNNPDFRRANQSKGIRAHQPFENATQRLLALKSLRSGSRLAFWDQYFLESAPLPALTHCTAYDLDVARSIFTHRGAAPAFRAIAVITVADKQTPAIKPTHFGIRRHITL
jgi:hypothetical protein